MGSGNLIENRFNILRYSVFTQNHSKILRYLPSRARRDYRNSGSNGLWRRGSWCSWPSSPWWWCLFGLCLLRFIRSTFLIFFSEAYFFLKSFQKTFVFSLSSNILWRRSGFLLFGSFGLFCRLPRLLRHGMLGSYTNSGYTSDYSHNRVPHIF